MLKAKVNDAAIRLVSEHGIVRGALMASSKAMMAKDNSDRSFYRLVYRRIHDMV